MAPLAVANLLTTGLATLTSLVVVVEVVLLVSEIGSNSFMIDWYASLDADLLGSSSLSEILELIEFNDGVDMEFGTLVGRLAF